MPHRTTAKKSIKHKKWPLTRLRALVNALTRALFEASDATAQQHGWQVSSTRHGFGRRYRDPKLTRSRYAMHAVAAALQPTEPMPPLRWQQSDSDQAGHPALV